MVSPAANTVPLELTATCTRLEPVLFSVTAALYVSGLVTARFTSALPLLVSTSAPWKVLPPAPLLLDPLVLVRLTALLNTEPLKRRSPVVPDTGTPTAVPLNVVPCVVLIRSDAAAP